MHLGEEDSSDDEDLVAEDDDEGICSGEKSGPTTTTTIPKGRVTADLEWSEQCAELDSMVRSRRNKSKTSFSEICSRLRTLKLRNCGITEMDDNMQRFTALEEVNLCRNQLRCVKNLPGSLVSLQAFDNRISRLELSDSPVVSSTLIHLGLGFNQISSLTPWIQDCSALVSLDLSYNALCNLGGTLVALQEHLCQLRDLRLEGNPIALVPQYRERACLALPHLVSLDGITLEVEDGEVGDNDLEGLIDQPSEELILMSCTICALNVNAVTDAHHTDTTLEEGESKEEESKDGGAAEEGDVADEVAPKAFTRRFLSVRATLPDEYSFETDCFAWPLQDHKKDEAADVDVKKQDKKSKNAPAVSEADDDASTGISHFDINLAVPRTARPSVALRDGIDLSGVSFDLICTLQTCVEVQCEVDVGEETETSSAVPDAEGEETKKEPLVEITATRHMTLAHGQLVVSRIFNPEQHGMLDIPDAEIAMDVVDDIPGQDLMISSASLIAAFSINVPPQEEAEGDGAEEEASQ
ncbi:Leucine-rich repeat-containing protein 43 [Hondaea fermentalgiana]|uniref:Leucine-rich repeat-containing protein 43 n=1 Tax=Hondaea fermentalgiana TaxID=2315210 RepID=A0A2R5GD15_9STRA|nr:Leucine-rich repeat-containing protein 43 [Hondaea fermentalgiana]|eukprot:GBG28209.1 Leucine-rich repeat-containing protein 43 [Hondaea fermentalgiana]